MLYSGICDARGKVFEVIDPALIAFISAIFYGLNSVLVKMGLTRDPNPSPMSATYITMCADLAALSIVYFAFSPPFVLEAFLVFAASGILAQCVARSLNYTGLHKLGVCRSTPITGANPIFATLFAAIFLQETLAWETYVGTALVILGIVLISQCEGGESHAFSKKWFVVPIAASVCYGLGNTLRKVGLNIQNSAIAGTTLGVAGGMFVYTTFLLASGKVRSISVNRRSVWFYVGSGLSTAVAWLLYFTALGLGKVGVVAPIQGSNPLFAVLLSQILLRSTEKISIKLVVGALAVVTGIVVVSMFK